MTEIVKDLAGRGLFAKDPQRLIQRLKTSQLSIDELRISELCHLPYTIECASSDSLEELFELEKQCWDTNLQCSRDILKNRLDSKFPESSEVFVAIFDGRIIGAIYTQRIQSIDRVLCGEVTFSTQECLKVAGGESGEIMHLLGVCSLGSYASLQIGQVLRNFALIIASIKFL